MAEAEENNTKIWGGNPPSCCTGACKIESGFLISECKECGWNDGYTGGHPTDTAYEI